MAKIGTRKPIKTRAELLRYLMAMLADGWDLSVDEIDSLSSTTLGRKPYRMTYLVIHAHLMDPVELFCSISATTLPQLIRKVEAGELWDKIKADFARKQRTWVKPAEPDLIDEDNDSDEGPRRIEGKQLALTYQPSLTGT